MVAMLSYLPPDVFSRLWQFFGSLADVVSLLGKFLGSLADVPRFV
jgi:hypothetical protein